MLAIFGDASMTFIAKNMKFGRRVIRIFIYSILLPLSVRAADSNTNVHTTWLWHLHQPIYWPDRAPANHAADHYQNAWDTIQLGNIHPSDTSLTTVFGAADRVNAYQGEPSSTVNGLRGYANAGAQVNYSGALMENVQSLAAQNQLGYGSGWNNGNSTARTWTTSSGKPRMDLVNFTYHHAMAPLVSDETLEMELRIHQRQMQLFWGTSVPLSRGYFPAETCFSEHMIPILNKVGIAWTVVANNHLSRTCPDMPIVTGSGGEMCDMPNLADQINPAQGAGSYRSLSIDRGCSPTQVMPFGFQLHYGRYVDPDTGTESKIILAPSDQAFGWKDSYSTWDLGLIAPVAARNNPAKPSLVLCAHDGDNAWSGGSSYYNEWVPQMASQATADGYEPTTIEQFINDFPPDANDVVHVEDGGWVFADGDMGSPSFINWNWPPSYSSNGANVVDPSIGVTDKGDNWRVVIATENRVKTAQQISGITPRIDQVRDPGSFSTTPNAVELGWHYYLGSLDSGFVYYGCTADECLRSIVAQTNACRNVDSILSNLASDTTPPTVFLPQRHPWNPGGQNFGVQYGYKTVTEPNSDFWVWTYAYDVSGITNVSLLIRNDGTNPPTSDQFKTYAGGPLAGAWQTTNMTQRAAANSSGYTPQFMADYYYAKVSGISNAFMDYYVSATDSHGNTYKSPIQHVWVGVGSGGGSGGSGSGGPVSVSPAEPVAGSPVTIQYVATGRNIAPANPVYIHLGWNNWNPVVSPDVAMTFNSASNWWQYTVAIPATATTLNCVFNNGSGTWDNNGGANWNFSVAANTTPQAPPTPASLTTAVVSASQINLSWPASAGATGYIVSRDGSPISSTAATSFSNTGLSLNVSYCYTVVATNSIGNSAPTASQCVTIQSPAAPTGLTATAASTNQINLSWPAVSGASSYFISRDSATFATTTATTYSDTGLAASSPHCYFLVASNSIGASAASVTVCTNTLAAASGSTNIVNVLPASPVAGNSVLIQYVATGRVLATANPVYLHLGWNNWNPVVQPDAVMTFNAASNCWQSTVTVPLTATQMNCCFNNGSGTWDNFSGSGTNWNFTVAGSIPPFALDGNFDSPGYLLAGNSMVLYGAVRGTTLYVATWSTGTSGPNDHFIFVTDQLLPSASAAAPWAKAGTVAISANKPFLASESQGTYVSWFMNNAPVNWPCAKSAANSGALEGTLDLVTAFGYMPTNIYLCAAAYVTTNGGPLVAQCPAGSGPNLDTNEFLVLPVAALRDSWGNGTLDLCDPARGFKMLSAGLRTNGFALNWAAMPGRVYQVQYAGVLGNNWNNLAGVSNDLSLLQMQLNYTDVPAVTPAKRFYRIQLLP
jgi:hypothetical protein